MIHHRQRVNHLSPKTPPERSTLGRLIGLSMLFSALLACNETTPEIQYHDLGAAPDSGLPFLGACTSDDQCSSGHCITVGELKICSKTCDTASSACPTLEGWSCSEGGVCQCSPVGLQADRCGVDGDCDGHPDKIPTTESCNGEDDDCNNTVDDVQGEVDGASLFYRDADGDGFGDVQVSRWSCQPEPGWVTQGGDCDDTAETTHLGAEEICGDLIDNDCDAIKDNPELCGRVPIVVSDVNGTDLPGTLKTCELSTDIDPHLDITEIVAKQDATYIKYAIFLAGNPSSQPCASFAIHLGITPAAHDIVYLFRPVLGPACAGLPALEAFNMGVPMSTELTASFLSAPSGQVTFTLPKMEFYPLLNMPTYHLKACSNSSATADPLLCEVDSCMTPIRRE